MFCPAIAPQRCYSNSTRDLDRAFLGDQLFAHYALFDQATVFRKHASEQMQPVLEECLPIIQRHIATLEKLMASMAQS